MATAAASAWSAMTNRRVGLSADLNDLPSSSVNVVHLRRNLMALVEEPSRAVVKAGLQVTVNIMKPQAAFEHLLSHVSSPSLQQQLHHDLMQSLELFSSSLQLDHVHAKLQVIDRQSCPNWHADSVGLRLLCTYAGPGTWYIANRFVQRRYNPWTGDVSIAGVDDTRGIQANAGDLLFLKGNAFPGLFGAGAVHKSPELQEGEQRLLLTMDDACC